MKKIIFFFVGIFIAQFNLLHGQILNIDKTDTLPYSSKARWTGNISLGLEVDKQKETLVDATNNLDVQFQKSRELFITSGSYRFTDNGGEQFLNEGFIHLRWRHGYKNSFQPETFLQFQWDDGRGMEHRKLAGINLRYNYWYKHIWELSAGVGVMYEDELWNYIAVDSTKIPPGATTVSPKAMKSNNYIKWEGQTSPNSIFSIVLFYQAAFNHFFSDPRIAGSARWDLSFSKHFSFTINYNGIWDPKPVVPITKFYYSFSNGITYKIR